MTDKPTNLHPKNDSSVNLKPNIIAENIPDNAVTMNKLDHDIQNDIKDIKAAIKDYAGINVLNLNTLTVDSFLNYADGTVISNQYTHGFYVTDYITVTESDEVFSSYARGRDLCMGCVYDKDKKFIGTMWGSSENLPSIEVNGIGKYNIANPKIAYVRLNVCTSKAHPSFPSLNSQWIYAVHGQPVNIFVGANRVGKNCFTTLRECCRYIQYNRIVNAVVHVDFGTYDLTAEFADMVDTYYSSSNTAFGLFVGNNTHFIFDEGAKIVFNYQGSHLPTTEHFSAFNIYGSCTLENADIEVTNARYCVHEDVPIFGNDYVPDKYTVKYINCKMIHHGNNIGTYTGTVCIGGGVNRNSLSIIDGGYYECGNQFPYAISYHNFYIGQFGSYPSKVIIRDVYISNTFRFNTSMEGADSVVDIEISGCSMGASMNIGNSDLFKVTAWNNTIR